MKQKLCALWGRKVRDYVVEKDGILAKVWEWKDWRVDGLSQRQQQSLKEIFMQRKVCIIDRKDKISWCVAASSTFSIKLGYELIENSEEVSSEAINIEAEKEIL